MESPDIIKAVVPHFCPSCNSEIFVKIHASPPSLASVLTRDDITNAKMEVLRELEKLGMGVVQLKAVRVEIMDESVLFGPEDVQSIVSQYKTT